MIDDSPSLAFDPSISCWTLQYGVWPFNRGMHLNSSRKTKVDMPAAGEQKYLRTRATISLVISPVTKDISYFGTSAASIAQGMG
jgi:hypothetical protein